MRRFLARIVPQHLTIQIVGALVFVGLLPILVAWTVIFAESRGPKPVDEYLQLMADHAAEMVRHQGLEHGYTAMQTLTKDWALQGQQGPGTDPTGRLRQLLAGFPRFRHLTLVDLEGRVLASSAPGQGSDWRGRDFFERAQAGHTAIAPAPGPADSPEPWLFYAAPVRDEQGSATAVLVGEMPLASVTSLADLPVGPKGRTFVVDSSGGIIADHRADPSMQNIGLTAGASPESRSVVEVEAKNETHVFAIAPVTFSPLLAEWRVVLHLPASQAYAFYWAAQREILLATLGALLLVVLVPPVLAISISGPVQKAEKALAQHSAALEAANKELEAFSYSVSHDLRAPLRSIDGFSQALLEDYERELDAQGRDYLHRVRAASQSMGQLIDDMLSLSRVTRREIRNESVDLSGLARSSATALQQSQPERQVEFSIADGLTAQGDPQLLAVALENLLSNAWKFTSKHPQATIEFGVAQPDGVPEFFVRDDGAGFDMAYSDKLFGAFQRLHTPAEFPGTGVGLATVQRIIHRHGGRIWAEGKVEQGATFHFTL